MQRAYDHETYSDQMFYFNTVTRVTSYDYDVRCEAMDHCYDCAAEISVWIEYLHKYVWSVLLFMCNF